MDLKQLSRIINSDAEDFMKESAIIMCLSKDKNVVPMMLNILKEERETTEILVTDMNAELSRAHVYLEAIDYKDIKKEVKTPFSQKFVLDNIAEFYKIHKDSVNHLYCHVDDLTKK